MNLIFSLIACLLASLCADLKMLSLGELGSVSYTSDESHLLHVERRMASGEVMYRHSYHYDESGKLVFESLIGDLGEIVYTGNGLIQTPFSLEICEYDENHNLIRHALDEVLNEYFYDDCNQLISEDEVPSCEYDCFGNVTSFGENQCVFDDEQNLVQVVTPTSVINYSYDQQGRRISRTLNGETQLYVYFGINEIAILDSDGNPVELRIPGLSFHEDVLRPIAIETKDAIYAPIHDVQGNIIRLINISNKQVFQINELSPFGKGLPKNAPTSWLFAGKNYDPEAGLIYFGERYYSPDLRSFLSPDPMKQSSNLYQYCLDNPFSYFDPDGAFAFAIPFVSIAWGAGLTVTAPIWAPYAAATALGAGIGYLGYKAYDHLQEKIEKPPYNGKELGEDASKKPAKGFKWKGKGDPKSGKGSWYNEETDESLHPDFYHPGEVKPHWDYINPAKKEARLFTDGSWEWK